MLSSVYRRLGEGAEQKSGEAFGWGILSASSLVLGAAIGIVKLPSKVKRATLMAFGGGALIEALSIELFAHIIAKAKGGHRRLGAASSEGRRLEASGDIDRVLVFIALASALGGGLFFAALDRAISGQGGFLRKASTVQTYVGRLRYAMKKRLMSRLRKVPMFEVLTTAELECLARSMVKEKYSAGSCIFKELTSDSSIFFLLSGRVELTVSTRYAPVPSAAPVPIDNNLSPGEIDIDVECAIDPRLGGEPRPKSTAPAAPSGGAAWAAGQAPTAGAAEAEEVKDCFLLAPNDIFGEMALFTGETLEAQAVAVSRAVVLRIPSSALHRMLASNRRLQDFIAMTAIDRLRETEVFCRCTPSTVARLVSFMRQAEFEAGDVLFYDIDSLCPIYFVVLGCVEVALAARPDGSGGQRHVVRGNGLLGTDHLVLGQPSPATATALERTTVLIVQRSDIDKLCERDERFRQALVSSALTATELMPPEGAAPPAKFGCAASALEDLGWRREVQPISPKASPEGPRTFPPAAPEPPVPGGSLDGAEPSPEDGEAAGLFDEGGGLDAEAELPDLLANEDAAAGSEHGGGHNARASQAATMIWLGILIDAVPESVVMGILVNTAKQGQLLAFVVGVFLANFPEAMSSAGTMRLHGMRKRVILVMWGSIMLMTGLGAFIGAVIFVPGSTDDPVVEKVIAGIEGLCGGAMLCMIANTVLPEAFEQGGDVTGLSCLMGFLVAIAVSVAA